MKSKGGLGKRPAPSEVFQSITADNGSEFYTLPIWEEKGTYIFYAHPQAPWERGKNEKHNAILRTHIPKGRNLDHYSEEDIAFIQDKINSKPRKQFGYLTPEELCEAELDRIYQRRDISVSSGQGNPTGSLCERSLT